MELVGAVGTFDIDLSLMADEQVLDADYRRISTNPNSGLSFRKVDIGNKDLIVDVSNGNPRPFVPFSWRRRIFDAVHGLGHPGVHRTQQTIADRFVWPSIRVDTNRWARECIACQQSKVTRHVVPPIGDFEVPSQRFTHLNMDLVTLTSSNGFSHLLTIVDRFTRWPVAVPIADITAETVADAFAHGWVATYGVPVAITTDRGSQFTSAIWTQLMSQWGIKSIMTAAYHPEANGMVERLHRRLKEALLALSKDHPIEWYWKLPLALLAIRTTLKPDIGASPADLVFGDALALPGDVVQTADPIDNQSQQRQAALLANLRVEVSRLQPTPTSAHRNPKTFIPGELATATHVFVRRGGVQPSLSAPYEGPFRVVSRNPAGYYVRLSRGRTERIALSRLKPAHVSRDQDDEEEPQDLDDEGPPSPRPPGRRPGIRTRQPAPTTRQTRSATRSSRDTPTSAAQQQQQQQQQQTPEPAQDPNIPLRAAARSNPQPDWPAAARPPPFRPPPTTVRRSTEENHRGATSSTTREHRRTRNIDEFPPSSLGPARMPRRDNPGLAQGEPPSGPTTPAGTSTSQQKRSISAPADDLFAKEQVPSSSSAPPHPLPDEENEPMRETGFFAPLNPAAPRPGSSETQLPSSLRSSRPPSGNRVRFYSDPRPSDPPRDRHYFSARRPRPDVSVILSHLSS